MGCFQTDSKELSYKIYLLDESELLLTLSPKVRGKDLLDRVFSHLNLVEIEYFGLRFHDNNENIALWLEPEKPLSKQLKARPCFLFFAVRFFILDPAKLAEEVTRYQFYLQLRRDLKQGKISVDEETAIRLGALVLQAESLDPESLNHDLEDRLRLVPYQTPPLLAQMAARRRQLKPARSQGAAEALFLHEVKWLPDYGIDRHKVMGEGQIGYHLNLLPTGIAINRNETRVANYLWTRISKLDYKKETFLLKTRDKASSESCFAFTLKSKRTAKHLWRSASSQRAFFTSSRMENPLVAQRRNRGINSTPVRKHPEFYPSPSTKMPPPQSPIVEMRDSNHNSRISSPVEKIVTSPPTVVDGTINVSAENADLEGALACAGGLFTAAGDSPLSSRSSHSARHRRRPQSESDFSHKTGSVTNRHRSRRNTNDGRPQNEETRAERRQRKKSRGSQRSHGEESASDASKKSRHRQRRHQKQTDVTIDSSEQWDRVQRDRVDEKENAARFEGVAVTRKIEKVGEEKKKRTRSKSPKSSKALPPEIIEHISHDLVDPMGFSDEQLRDIPFTNVVTKQRPRRISPHGKSVRNSFVTGDEEEMKVAKFKQGLDLANVKTANLAALSSRNPGVHRKGLAPLDNGRRGVGAVPVSGGGAIYFPNGIPSGYFSDATSMNVWADDEMDA